jgi:predicted transcriptional regulator
MESVKELMQPCTSTLRPTSTPAEAAMTMLKAEVKEATVTGKDGELIGVVYASDLFDAHADTIESVIKPALVVIPVDASSMDAVRIMQKVGCDHAVIVDGVKVVGQMTWNDVLERLAD